MMPTCPPTITSAPIGNAAGDSGLRRDHRVFSHDNVVGHLHQVVEILYAVLNPCPTKTGAVDRRVGADFDVVVNLQIRPAGSFHSFRLAVRSQNHLHDIMTPL